MQSIGRDPFARGEYVRKCHSQLERSTCAWCGQKKKRLYTYVWVDDGIVYRSLDRAHYDADLFCNFDCFKSYNS